MVIEKVVHHATTEAHMKKSEWNQGEYFWPMQNHLHANQINISNSFSIFQRIFLQIHKIYKTFWHWPTKRIYEYYCLFAHSADSRFKEPTQINWKGTCTVRKKTSDAIASTKPNQLNKRKKPIWLDSIRRLGIFRCVLFKLYKLNIKRNCKKHELEMKMIGDY